LVAAEGETDDLAGISSLNWSRAVSRQNLPIDSGDIATITLSMLAEWSGARSVGRLLRGEKTDKGHMGAP
jgi:hypothetical protein